MEEVSTKQRKDLISEAVHVLAPLWKGEPLDGDETENVAIELLIGLDLANGNITESEAAERLKEWVELGKVGVRDVV